MGALIRAFGGEDLPQAIRRLSRALKVLRQAVKGSWHDGEDMLNDQDGWAGKLKAFPITIQQADLIDKRSERLVEIISQCPTVERLLNVLRWAASRGDYRSARVLYCNPTTGSGAESDGIEIPAPLKTLDLVLRLTRGMYAFFEVSDNIGEASRKKELQEIASLRTASNIKEYQCGQCYRVVTKAAGQKALSPRRRTPRDFTYQEVSLPGRTTMLLRVNWLSARGRRQSLRSV